MTKSADAFRTISEVSLLLDTPTHVLRFWESRFPQIKPLKRAGGRRYYRPGDVALLAGIKQLLHEDGLTIRGVQKILKEQGISAVTARAAIRLEEPAGDSAETPARVVPFPDRTPPDELFADPEPEAEESDTFAAASAEEVTDSVSASEAESPAAPAEPEVQVPDTLAAPEAEIPDAPFAPDVPQDDDTAEVVSFGTAPEPSEPSEPAPGLAALMALLHGMEGDLTTVERVRLLALSDRMAALRDRLAAPPTALRH
ncbi:MerR family transcriptional regulator [Sinirhodobacter populi]|uniref:MerR family transcriptional regulator n=1 Tax=Paenirhodobacter populi TaxID=2306993 RepID=A0A443KB08_9RHOB|nr:MerR family transcriptional regulator [Sinirhodobacter populi]RWR29948.1 MerR family transcriptional regulator [Sinirhodobacter populi]